MYKPKSKTKDHKKKLLVKMKTTTFSVEGMMCGGCAASVEKAALDVQGVQTAFASLDSHSLTVDYAPETTSPEAIMKAVRLAGFECKL